MYDLAKLQGRSAFKRAKDSPPASLCSSGPGMCDLWPREWQFVRLEQMHASPLTQRRWCKTTGSLWETKLYQVVICKMNIALISILFCDEGFKGSISTAPWLDTTVGIDALIVEISAILSCELITWVWSCTEPHMSNPFLCPNNGSNWPHDYWNARAQQAYPARLCSWYCRFA